jgi:hypothetical protein
MKKQNVVDAKKAAANDKPENGSKWVSWPPVAAP